MIQVENLTKYYNEFCAVDNINLSIPKGEILGLLGPNGAGKTTTLRMLTGFLKPTSGDIRVEGLSISKELLKIKSFIGYLPESAPLYHNMLVYDYLEFVAGIKRIPREKRLKRLEELSSMCGLSRIMHKSVNSLSKGLKQRVGLAHAMMSDPEILVLDEPTSGLDPNQIADIRAIIRSIGKKKTIIFSTHILSEAEATCDRIVIINRGKIVADDTSSNLKAHALKRSRVRISLKGADPDAAENLFASLDAGVKVKRVDGGVHDGVSFDLSFKGDGDPREEIYLAVKNTDWIMTELTRESQTLETIFQELTRGSDQ